MDSVLIDGLSPTIMAAVAALIIGIIQVIKDSPLDPGPYAGVVAAGLGLGLGIGCRMAGIDGDIAIAGAALSGLVAGLGAAGAYSGTKAALLRDSHTERG